MALEISKIITDWVPSQSKVIDFGCGDGSLLKDLIDTKNICGYGVEIDPQMINECIEKGISVIEKDIDKGIQDFELSNFDIAIMASSIQCLKNPNIAMRRMLRLSNKCIVTLPNFGYWRCRLALLAGKMPVTPSLPSSWYETENVHLCTISDFEKLCSDSGFIIDERIFLNSSSKKGVLASIMPNIFASEGVYLLGRK
ncbi:methionine biosynthesis protein MetW [Gammaproteobacteria bacterium]|nr:methionine biosynthesis protein MetW [Gammaproteobacteria bacterium]MDA8955633.1 methionine biosynthesis protein MetW [Gammaproteobacteria bacterium]MDA9102471.1 methionine biosynthesis protein MetW [Gammaproteobacteria bacterium]